MIKIIAADDEQYLRDALPALIPWEELGGQLIKVCKDGRELIEAVDELKPDIVITDIRMPVMDGMEVCRYIHEKYPEIDIIVLSAYSDFAYARTVMKYDVSEYILKADVIEDLPGAVAGIIALRKKANEPETQISGENDGDLLIKLQEYISVHYREDISLSDVAKELHANPSYLSRMYKNKTGTNIFDDIQNRRMEKAKECLLVTDMKIAEVAEYVGFNDAGYFARQFKKTTGVSPRDYRQGRV